MSDETPDHYFTAQPASPDERRTLSVVLDSQTYEVETAGGIFSPGRVDLGTSVLLRTVADPPAGDLLDLGCGWGPITLTMALQNRQATVWGVDVNDRALDLLRRNAERLGLDNVRAVRPEEVPADLRLSEIWSNPPIRVGKDVLHGMLDTWLPRLVPGASAYLVVQRNLGADSLQGWMTDRYAGEVPFAASAPHGPFSARVAKRASAKGFRVIEVTRR